MSKTVYYPLSSSFMAISIIGFFISIWLVGDWSPAWGFALAFFFVIMFVSSVVSMSKAEPIPKHMNELAIHEPNRKKKTSPKEYSVKKAGKFNPKWYDAIFIVFVVLAGYYMVQAMSLSQAKINPVWFILVMSAYVIVLVWLIVDALSSNKIAPIWQTIFVLLMLILGPLGLFIYYFYKRAIN